MTTKENVCLKFEYLSKIRKILISFFSVHSEFVSIPPIFSLSLSFLHAHNTMWALKFSKSKLIDLSRYHLTAFVIVFQRQTYTFFLRSIVGYQCSRASWCILYRRKVEMEVRYGNKRSSIVGHWAEKRETFFRSFNPLKRKSYQLFFIPCQSSQPDAMMINIQWIASRATVKFVVTIFFSFVRLKAQFLTVEIAWVRSTESINLL